jgi:hypothetical protein
MPPLKKEVFREKYLEEDECEFESDYSPIRKENTKVLSPLVLKK